jgi:serine protease Do
MKRRLAYASVAAVAIVTLTLAWPDLVGRVAYAIESGQAAAARAQISTARDLSEAFEYIATANRPSVVYISSVRRVAPSGRMAPSPFDDEFLRRFFGDRMPQNPRGNSFVQRGAGTGVIVSDDGYILTNNHVVESADELKVTLSDDRQFDAKVIGTDAQTDLAVVRIEASNLVPAQLGDSDKLKVGQWVLAMGNPFGLTQTVTAGIISATGRANVGIADYEDFIQTDAAINPGNSGGPLVNLDGEVIGINTAIASRNGGYQGIGFAIPSNMARQIMSAIIDEGHVVRGWLGVVIQALTPELAQSFGYDGTDGVLIGDVTRDGPAASAGIESGDIVLKFGDVEIEDFNQLKNRVAATAPGTTVDVLVWRNGERMTIPVEIGELESPGDLGGGGGQPQELGVSLRTITPEIAAQLGLDENATGVVVTAVEPGSAAEESGLRRGDVIVTVGSTPIEDLADFSAALRTLDLDAGVRLRVMTDGMQRFVFLKR